MSPNPSPSIPDHTADEVVITGAGLVTCLGADRQSTWQAVAAGRCGVGPLTALESRPAEPRTGGQAVDLPGESGAEGAPREVRYLRHAIRAALREAGLRTDQTQLHEAYPAQRCALLMGTTLHGMRNGGAFLRSNNHEHLNSFLAGSTIQQALADIPIGGLRATTCSACSSGLASVALGVSMLRHGEADVVLAGGYDPISEYAYAGFSSMRLVSGTEARPFSRHRDGMKVSEGYACVVLERAASARARGATALARIAGFGEACDAFHLSKPHPEGDGAAAAIRTALSRAGLEPGEVDMIAAHATATPDNDAAEYAALRQVFGPALAEVPVVAFKSHLGHTLGGAGAVELVLSAMAISEGVVPPCASVTAEEAGFSPLRLQTGEHTRRALSHTVNLSLGFGGANACVVLGRANQKGLDESTRPTTSAVPAPLAVPTREDVPVYITGVGVVVPGAVGNEAFVQRLASIAQSPRGAGTHCDDLPVTMADGELDGLLNARRARRMSQYAKLCLAATTAAYRDADIHDVAGFGRNAAAITASTHGAAEFCEAYYRQIITEGLEAANPTLFAEGVPNVGSAHLSTHFSIRGFCQTIIGSRTAGLDAMHLAATLIRRGIWDRVVVCAAEEYTALVTHARTRFAHPGTAPRNGGAADSDPSGEGRYGGSGAVSLILESASSVEKRGIEPRGRLTAAGSTSWPRGQGRMAVERIAALLDELGPADGWLAGGQAGSPLQRLERACLRRAMLRGSKRRVNGESGPPALSSVLGYIPQVYSVLPLAGLAASLLTGHLPARLSNTPTLRTGIAPARGDERVSTVNLLAVDDADMAGSARVQVLPRSMAPLDPQIAI